MPDEIEQVALALDDLVVAFVAWARTKRTDLSPTAASVLTTLSREGPTRVVDLAATAGITQQSMTTLVASLCEQGLAAREPDPRDGRAVLITATPRGSRLPAQRRADRTDSLAPLLAGLRDGGLRDLAGAVPAMAELTEALRRSRSRSEVSR